ncbi:hypothetical protein MTR67_008688 [Solanum verrucosum]|uniref:Uncharacterized protein n=1 Tax=Solanum verrucosum TaxID=315347 RepID=A0AAF0Q2M3_SOLVR|nr:hypothetical protein MTR67_008688 [Solanum verrucosum]
MISEAAKKSIEETIREYDSGSYVSVETSQEIDSVSLDNIIVEKLRERGSLRTQQGDNLYRSTDDEEFLSFEKKGSRVILFFCYSLQFWNSPASLTDILQDDKNGELYSRRVQAASHSSRLMFNTSFARQVVHTSSASSVVSVVPQPTYDPVNFFCYMLFTPF